MYIDIWHDTKKNVMCVNERIDGQRVEKTIEPSLFYYYEDPSGTFLSTTGVSCSKFIAKDYFEYKTEIEQMHSSRRRTFESDIKPIFKSLEHHYKGAELPKLNLAFFDIETGWDEERGFSDVDEAFMPITAISIYQGWCNKLHTLVLKPTMMDKDEANAIVAKFEYTTLCDSESKLLDMFMTLIEDADVFTGWNSSSYDVPYIINRIRQVRGERDLKRFCLWGQKPKERKFERFGEEITTYDFVGRLHLDYLDLYRKYTYHEMPSYRLDYVGNYEIGETKVAYSGTLDQLYNKDFEKFIAYSRQDSEMLYKMDKKLDFINLVNFIAHQNMVPFATVSGAVALSDNAILLETHLRGMVAPTTPRTYSEEDSGEDESIAGAYVKEPITGMHDWVGSIDIASLYPSAFRALNMSPETIIGQIQQDLTEMLFESKRKAHTGSKPLGNSELWAGVFEIPEVTEIWKQNGAPLTLVYEDGTKNNLTAAQIWERIQKHKWILSANGTIFRTDIQGVIPSLLARWYSERKEYQKKLGEIEKKIVTTTDPSELKTLKAQRDYWDKRQLVTKIMLNSVYGAVTNKGSKYYDQRMGQSCTLTGRCITLHMGKVVNQLLTGEYTLGDTVIYQDTDSAYFTPVPVTEILRAGGFEINKDSFVELANGIAEGVNETFPDFMLKNFNVPLENGKIIKCGREICATRTMFIKKKRYMCLYYDKENKRKDKDKTGELKLMGIETQRSDTPVWVQDKLEELIRLVLEENSEDKTIQFIKAMRGEFIELPSWKKGTPKRVNNLTHYTGLFNAGTRKAGGGKIMIPGHVQAAINYNKLREQNSDNHSMKITDGMKTIVCKLKPNNHYDITSVGIPIDQETPPDWFKALPFDNEAMVETIIDKKVENVIGILNWSLSKVRESDIIGSFFEVA